MPKICVCGAFRLGDVPKGGQEIKTCILADVLEEKFGKVFKIDTLAANSRLFMPFQLLWAMFTCTDIIILPAHNGLIVLSKLLTLLNLFFHRSLHYSVIGGWLQDLLPKYPVVMKALHKFKGIYVETHTMQDALLKLGLKNVYVVPNCKHLSIVSADQMPQSFSAPYKLVTFSRVTKKKGIETAVHAVMNINEKYGRKIFSLDIYGPIDSGEDEIWFNDLKKQFDDSISYKGCVLFDRTTVTLSRYFTLLFPTQYYTEGIPGTIIDAYAAGVPIIASKWKSFSDVIEDGETGFGYQFGKEDRLEKVLEEIVQDPSKITRLKMACIKKAKDYLPENALIPLFDRIK